MIRDKGDRTDDGDQDGASPRDRGPQEDARDGKECRIRHEREDQPDRDLVLRLVFLERSGRGVPRKEVDGQVHQQGEEEER